MGRKTTQFPSTKNLELFRFRRIRQTEKRKRSGFILSFINALSIFVSRYTVHQKIDFCLLLYCTPKKFYLRRFFCIKASYFYFPQPFIQFKTIPICVCAPALVDLPPKFAAKMTEPGNSKSPEEINNQLRPHPSETFPNVAAQTLNITNSGEGGVSSSKFRQQRYLVSILVLASLMLATCLVQSMASSTNRTLQYVTLPCSLCFAFYVYQWVVYYSDGLTPRKMAHFDPRNLFKTYQPHKYIEPVPKSPPTPNVPTLPTKDAIQQENGQSRSAAEIGSMQAGGEFNAQRKEYYRNEYTNALEGAPKTAKEAEDDEEYQTGTKDDDQNE